MSKRTRVGAILAAMCGVQIVAVAIYFRNRAAGDDTAPTAIEAAEPEQQEQQRRRLTAGVPMQRKRIDAFIAMAGAYPDYDALAAGLNDPVRVGDGFDVVFAAGLQTQATLPQVFAMVLSDRRVARMYELLEDMDAREACRRADELVDAKLKLLKEQFATRIAAMRAAGGADEPRTVIGRARRDFHALSAAVVLCASFCDSATLLEKVDRWTDVVGPLVDEIRSDPVLRYGLQQDALIHGRPDRLFLLNLYVFYLQRHTRMIARDVEQHLDVRTPLFREVVPFCAWNAHTNPFDFTHFHRGVPVDEAKVLTKLSFARSWAGGLEFNFERQSRIVARARGMIEELDADSGMSVHRQQTADFIAQTGAYRDYEAVAAALNHRVLNSDAIAVAVPVEDPSPQLQFARVLADRRVARLYAMLREAGPGEASRRAAELFDEKLRLHLQRLDAVLSARRRLAGEPITNGEGVRIYGACRRSSHALSSALWLCAAFCDVPIVLAKLDKWEQGVRREVDDVLSDPDLKEWNPGHRALGRPERLYLLNLYAFLLERHARMTPRDVLQRVDMKIPGPELFQERVGFCAWDAPTNPFEFTHLHHGVPIDRESLLLEVSFAPSWRYLWLDADRQQELVWRVRSLLEELDQSRGTP